jgi:RNA polymerase sigma-70 factor, ECF subfamily
VVEAPGLRRFLRESAAAAYDMRVVASEFEAIFLEHYPGVLRALVRVVGNRSQAEELANEVFWRLSRQPASWLRTNDIGGWLYRTAVHAGIDALRAAAHRTRYETAATVYTGNAGASEAGALDELLREEQRVAIRRVLASMKPAQAQLLLMRADGLSYKELAETLQVAVGGIGTLLNRAEAEFRKRYLKATGKKEEL